MGPGLRVEAGLVGSEALLGAPVVHLSGNDFITYDLDLLGTYHRRGNGLINDHAVYIKQSSGCTTALAAMWYSAGGWWKVGYSSDVALPSLLFGLYALETCSCNCFLSLFCNNSK